MVLDFGFVIVGSVLVYWLGGFEEVFNVVMMFVKMGYMIG